MVVVWCGGGVLVLVLWWRCMRHEKNVVRTETPQMLALAP